MSLIKNAEGFDLLKIKIEVLGWGGYDGCDPWSTHSRFHVSSFKIEDFSTLTLGL